MSVHQNPACVDQNQCNYEGLTCKSNATEYVEAYERLLRDNNTLVDNYNGFLTKHKELVADFDETLEAARALKSDYDQVKSGLDGMESCLIIACTFEAAKLCAQ